MKTCSSWRSRRRGPTPPTALLRAAAWTRDPCPCALYRLRLRSASLLALWNCWNGDDDLADVSTCGCSRPCREISCSHTRPKPFAVRPVSRRLCFWPFSPSYVAGLSCLAVCLAFLGGLHFSSRRLAVFGSRSRLLLRLVVCLTALLECCC